MSKEEDVAEDVSRRRSESSHFQVKCNEEICECVQTAKDIQEYSPRNSITILLLLHQLVRHVESLFRSIDWDQRVFWRQNSKSQEHKDPHQALSFRSILGKVDDDG